MNVKAALHVQESRFFLAVNPFKGFAASGFKSYIASQNHTSL